MSIFTEKDTALDAASEIKGTSPPVIDASIRVFVSESGLEARLRLDPPENGGALATAEDMLGALKKNGVTHGIDRAVIDGLAKNPIYGENVSVAKGREPQHGKNGTVTVHFQTGQRSLKPKENEDGTVDYRDLDLIENVVKGQLLCTITPPTEGRPGVTVKGVAIPQKKSRPAPPCAGKNTYLSADGLKLFAKLSGQAELIANKVCVNDTYFVDGNVDLTTGNIRAAASVVVRGNVLPGFSVETGGSLDVHGTVESAKITAGGNMRVRGGTVGSEICCEGTLVSRFIENCDIFCAGNVESEYVMHSVVRSGGNISTYGKRSCILGGSCVAGGSITSGTIGSPAGVNTKVKISSRRAVLGRNQELIERKANLEKTLEGLRPLMTLYDQLQRADRITPEKQETFKNILKKQSAAREELDEVNAQLEEVKKPVQSQDAGKVICRGTVYPGTEITIGPAKLILERDTRCTAFYLSEGEISTRPAI